MSSILRRASLFQDLFFVLLLFLHFCTPMKSYWVWFFPLQQVFGVIGFLDVAIQLVQV